MNQKLVLKAGRLPKYVNKNKNKPTPSQKTTKKKKSELKTATLLQKSYQHFQTERLKTIIKSVSEFKLPAYLGKQPSNRYFEN